ncbi:MAG TPA: hypothetical protein H9694_01670 [Firmicutes bacterium]|nr:hypothetical protein [Bacillota bacterium]
MSIVVIAGLSAAVAALAVLLMLGAFYAGCRAGEHRAAGRLPPQPEGGKAGSDGAGQAGEAPGGAARGGSRAGREPESRPQVPEGAALRQWEEFRNFILYDGTARPAPGEKRRIDEQGRER